MTDAKDWEQLPDESDRAFEAFKVYRDMGSKRSLLAAFRLAARHSTGIKAEKSGPKSTKVKQPSGSWKTYYARFRWKARARAYDESLDRAKTGAIEKSVARAAQRSATDWAARLVDLNQQVYDSGQQIMSQAMLVASFPVVTRTVEAANGDPVHIYRASPPADLAAAARLAQTGQEMCYKACESALLINPARPANVIDPADVAEVVAGAERLLSEFHRRQNAAITARPGVPRPAPESDVA